MAEVTVTRRWTYWSLFLGLALLIIFVKLLPLHPAPGRIPGPDVLTLFALAWVVRRPDYVPVLLVAAVFLMADILFMRPPGLWTALVILALEFLRARSVSMRDMPFLVEWLTVAGVITAMIFANGVMLTVFIVDQPGLGQALIRMIATILAYPLVVALAARGFGLKKIAPGEVDQLGHKR